MKAPTLVLLNMRGILRAMRKMRRPGVHFAHQTDWTMATNRNPCLGLISPADERVCRPSLKRDFLPTLTTGITMRDGWEIDGLTQRSRQEAGGFLRHPIPRMSRSPIIPAGWPWRRRIPQSSTSPASLLTVLSSSDGARRTGG